MNSFRKTVLSIGLSLQSLVLVAQPAFALGLEKGEVTANRLNDVSTVITIKGKLLCAMGAQNNGEACALKIQENGTGRVIRLSNTAQVMRLYQDGKTQVAVQGQMADAQTLQVQQVQTTQAL